MPTAKILTPSFDASSAASSGSLSVSSPSVSSRITCPRVASDAPALPRRRDQLVERGADGAADGGAAHRHVPRVEVAPEQLHRRVVGGGRVGQRLARERHQADAIAGQRRRAARPARAWPARAATGRCRSPASTARSRAPPPCPARAASRGAPRPPAWGRASATAISASATTISAARTTLRGTDTPAAMRAMSAASPRRAQPAPPHAEEDAVRQHHHRHQQQQPERVWVDEAHGQGSLRKRVRRSAISAAAARTPASRKRG